MSLSPMSHVEFKKWPCHPVDFRGQGPSYSEGPMRGHCSYFIFWCILQGAHCTGKTGKPGKMAKKNPCQGKQREFGNFAKTQGIWFAQVVKSLILKVKDISKFAAKISQKNLKLDKSNEKGKKQGKHRECENAI